MPFLACILPVATFPCQPLLGAVDTCLGNQAQRFLTFLTTSLTNWAGVVFGDRANAAEEVPESASEVVGAEETLSEIRNHLKDGSVGILGIYGMGGVGKTTVLQRINNEFFEAGVNRRHSFDLVVLVTVSQTVSIPEIQKNIADRLSLSLSESSSEEEKARLLFKALSDKRFLVLLDDIWVAIDLQVKIGIPTPNRRRRNSKIVFTTRSLQVCVDMGADKRVPVKPLDEAASWELFRGKLCGAGKEVILTDPNVRILAQKVVRRCGGLPLSLVTVGRAMANRVLVQDWEHAVNALDRCAERLRGMDSVLGCLKFSYSYLEDDNLRSALLFCAMYPEDADIVTAQLVEYWVGEGLVDDENDAGQGSIDDARGAGHALVSKLRDACLLEPGRESWMVRMHDAVRDMALWINREDNDKAGGFFFVYDGLRPANIATRTKGREHDVKRISMRNRNLEEGEETLLIGGGVRAGGGGSVRAHGGRGRARRRAAAASEQLAVACVRVGGVVPASGGVRAGGRGVAAVACVHAWPCVGEEASGGCAQAGEEGSHAQGLRKEYDKADGRNSLFFVKDGFGPANTATMTKGRERDVRRIWLRNRETLLKPGEIPIGSCSTNRTLILPGIGASIFLRGAAGSMKGTLRVLDLTGCGDLEELPGEVGSMTEVRYLNLTGTPIRSLPRELGNLVKLRQLVLNGMHNLREIPREAFAGLRSLQVLHMWTTFYDWEGGGGSERLLKVGDLETELHRLEELNIQISTPGALERLLRSRKLCRCTRQLYIKKPMSQVHRQCEDPLYGEGGSLLRRVLSSMGGSLRRLYLRGDNSHPWEGGLRIDLEQLPLLEHLRLTSFRSKRMPDLVLVGTNNIPRSGRINVIRLSRFDMSKCQGPRVLRLVGTFPCLQELRLGDCGTIEELALDDGSVAGIGEEGTQDHDDDDAGLLDGQFPMLRHVVLDGLPALRSMGRRPLHLPALRTIFVMGCPGLRRIPLDAAGVPKLERILGPLEWWDAVECVGSGGHDTKPNFEKLFIEKKQLPKWLARGPIWKLLLPNKQRTS